MPKKQPKGKMASKGTAKELQAFVRKFCQSHADPAIVKKYIKFFKEGYDGYGVDVKAYEEAMKTIKEKFGCSLKLALDAGPLLLKSGKYEETSIAIRLLKDCQKDFMPKTFEELEKWFDIGIINWAHADFVAGDVTPIFIINNIVPLKSFESWRKAENKFQRRVSAVTLIKLLKTEKNTARLVKFVEPMMMDNTREVQQGVGWFLREAWKIDRAPVEAFLLKWKDKSPRLIYQYATEKMTPEEKQKFRKEKK